MQAQIEKHILFHKQRLSIPELYYVVLYVMTFNKEKHGLSHLGFQSICAADMISHMQIGNGSAKHALGDIQMTEICADR